MNIHERVSIERKKFKIEFNNRFAFWFGQIIQYQEFLDLIYCRYQDASKNWLENHNQFTASIPKKVSGQMSQESMALMSKNSELSRILLLEIESYYLFAKILLDKTAYFIVDFFGSPKDLKMKKSHHGLMDKFKKYALSKKLNLPDGFSAKGQFLLEHVSGFRDKKISHLNNPRLIKGFSFNPEGLVNVCDSYAYPKPDEINKQGKAKNMEEVKQAIDEYIEIAVNLIVSNPDSSIYDRDIT